MKQIIQTTTHFLKHAVIKLGLILRANWAYLLWGILHIVLAYYAIYGLFRDEQAAISYVLAIYGVSIGIAISPLGEFIMRSLERARPVETRQDKDYLLPLFEEVYQEAVKRTPSLNKHIKLYITEDKSINAYAIGRKTVMLTRGAIASLSPQELKGMIAHEFGHMSSGDSIASCITIIGNGVFTIIVLIFRTIMLIYQLIAAIATKKYILSIIVSFFMHLLFSYTVAAFLFLGNIILALNSRYREYLADNFAYEIGYGEELKNMLYQINTLNAGGRQSLKEWLKSSHPHTTARIAKLEQKLEQDEEY